VSRQKIQQEEQNQSQGRATSRWGVSLFQKFRSDSNAKSGALLLQNHHHYDKGRLSLTALTSQIKKNEPDPDKIFQ